MENYNMQNKIELKSIGELLSANFYIPSYQRGYRWDKQQVKDLLDDLLEFIQKGAIGIYCIQPLVVKKDYEANPCLIEEIHNDEDLASIDAKLSRANYDGMLLMDNNVLLQFSYCWHIYIATRPIPSNMKPGKEI